MKVTWIKLTRKFPTASKLLNEWIWIWNKWTNSIINLSTSLSNLALSSLIIITCPFACPFLSSLTLNESLKGKNSLKIKIRFRFSNCLQMYSRLEFWLFKKIIKKATRSELHIIVLSRIAWLTKISHTSNLYIDRNLYQIKFKTKASFIHFSLNCEPSVSIRCRRVFRFSWTIRTFGEIFILNSKLLWFLSAKIDFILLTNCLSFML